MKEFVRDYAKNLPDAYEKDAGSNNGKLLKIESDAIDKLNTDTAAVYDMVDLLTATGATLDLYGDMLSQARGLATDDQFKYLIRAKIYRNLAGGSYSDIADALCKTFHCDPTKVFIEEADEPAAVNVIMLPLPVIIAAGFTVMQTMQLIKTMLPAGVSVSMFRFDGTLVFSDSLDEKSDTEGFADDAGTIGGYFGLLASDDNETKLPI